MNKFIKQLIRLVLNMFGMIWSLKDASGKKVVYLTFDDGPHPEYTSQVLDVLAENKVRATFFIVGNNAEKYDKLMSRIVNDGHIIGNHTYTHKCLDQASYSEIDEEIEKTDRLLNQWSGNKKHLIRLPKGQLGLLYCWYSLMNSRNTIFWNVDPKDFICSHSRQVLNGINVDDFRGGEIILLHDNSVITVDALKSLIPDLLNRGYKFKSLEL